jgi:YebC/PmpR family DNA-binding regulatory protein
VRRGTGAEEGVNYEEITYEGYGPGGVAILIEAVTDNRNRTVAEIRHMLSKNGGNLGEAGSVGWLFEKKGYIVVEKTAKPEDDLFEIAIEAGADDLRDDEDNFEIITSPDNFEGVQSAIKSAGIEPQMAEVSMVPQTYVKLD